MKATDAQRKQVFELASEGMSMAKIAERVGLHRSSVFRMIKASTGRRKTGATDIVLSARMAESEVTQFEELSRRLGFRTKSICLRALVRCASGYFEADSEMADVLNGVKSNLDRVGGNLNQVAAALSRSINKTGKAELQASQIQTIHQIEDEVHILRGA